MHQQHRPSIAFASLSRLLLVAGLVAVAPLTLTACDDDTTETGTMDTAGGDATGDTSTGDLSGDMPGDADTTPPAPTCSETGPCPRSDQVCDLSTNTCVARCTDTSCDTGQVCDQESGLCVEGAACATADDCTGADEVCNACRGVCEPADGRRVCENDSNCFSDQFCEPCTDTCADKVSLCEPCAFDRECGATEDRCIDLIASGGRFCLQQCTATDCPPGYRCADITDGVRQCVPASGDCAAPAQCEGENDSECPGQNEICRNGQCVPGCTMGGCPSGQVCDAGRCQAPCDQRATPCPMPSMCDTPSGLCKIEGQCAASRDCPPQNYCDTTTQQCVPGCEDDDDCGSFTLECVDMSCEPRGCEGAYACGFEQVCDLGTGMCAAAEGPYCETCDPNDDMACGGEPNKCLSLQDADGNALGDFCMVACSDDPANVCPQGYQCVDLQDQDGNPAGSVCYRDCTIDPFE